jgi:hypothetical protein
MQNAGCTALITPVISTPCCEFAMMAMAIIGIPHPHPRPHTRAPAARSPQQPAAARSPQPAVAAVAVAVAVVAALVGGTRRAAHACSAYRMRMPCGV